MVDEADDPRPPDIAPEALSAPLAIGETTQGAATDIRVLAARELNFPARRAPKRDSTWFGVRAEVCKPEDSVTPSRVISWARWAAVGSDGARYRGAKVAWKDYKSPQLPTDPIAPGDCSEGWVLISVPADTISSIKKVVFRRSEGGPSRWRVGGR